MFFNSTLLYALTLTNFCSNSPFFALSPLKKTSNFQLKELKFSNFFNHALKVDHLSHHIRIDGSKFSNFLKTALFIRSVPEDECHISPIIDHSNVQVVFVRCVKVLNSSFVNADAAYENGGAINCILEHPGHYLLVDRCNFTSCKAQHRGGAIYFIGSRSDSLYNAISYCIFTSCYCYNGLQIPKPQENSNVTCEGGSVYCEAYSVNFRNSIFNSSKIYGDGRGGAIYARVNKIDNFTFVTEFHDCSIDNGNISYGGAMYIDLIEKGAYNMSYIIFDKCNARNGQCVYAQNINNLRINYISLTSITNCLIKVDVLDFPFSIDTIILNDDYDVKLIEFNSSNYTGSDSIVMTLYAPRSANLDNSHHFFSSDIIRSCYIYLNHLDDYHGYPFIAPLDASLPLEAIYITPPTDQVITPQTNTPETVPTNVITATNIIITSQEIQTSVPIQTPVATPSQTPNYTEIVAAGVVAKDSGLSIVAIIFIVIACLIFLIALIVIILFLMRSRGRCRCGKDEPTLGVRSSTYF